MAPDLNRTDVERSLRRRLYVVSCGGVFLTACLMVVLLVAVKTISPTTVVAMGVVCSLCIGIATMAIILNARKRLRPFAADLSKPPDEAEQARLKSSVRLLLVYELFFAFSMVYGLSQMTGPPWLPILAGCGISLLIQSWLIRLILRLQKRLKLARDAQELSQ